MKENTLRNKTKLRGSSESATVYYKMNLVLMALKPPPQLTPQLGKPINITVFTVRCEHSQIAVVFLINRLACQYLNS